MQVSFLAEGSGGVVFDYVQWLSAHCSRAAIIATGSVPTTVAPLCQFDIILPHIPPSPLPLEEWENIIFSQINFIKEQSLKTQRYSMWWGVGHDITPENNKADGAIDTQ